jgi:hypothetical protein
MDVQLLLARLETQDHDDLAAGTDGHPPESASLVCGSYLRRHDHLAVARDPRTGDRAGS